MSLADYSDLEKEIKDAPETHILKRGEEHKVRIVSVNSGEGDYGKWHRVTFEPLNDPNAMFFSDFFTDPESAAADSDARRKASAFRKFKNFAECFGIDYSKPFSWADDLPRMEGWVIVGVKKTDEYGDQNTVSKYLAPK